MEAFESFMVRNFPRVRTTSSDYEYARQLWRATLEWAESKKLTHNPQVIPTYAIKKELEDK